MNVCHCIILRGYTKHTLTLTQKHSKQTQNKSKKKKLQIKQNKYIDTMYTHIYKYIQTLVYKFSKNSFLLKNHKIANYCNKC